MLSKETWQEVYLTSDVDSALQIFRDNFDYYFNTAFPYKLHKHKNTQDNNIYLPINIYQSLHVLGYYVPIIRRNICTLGYKGSQNTAVL